MNFCVGFVGRDVVMRAWVRVSDGRTLIRDRFRVDWVTMVKELAVRNKRDRII